MNLTGLSDPTGNTPDSDSEEELRYLLGLASDKVDELEHMLAKATEKPTLRDQFAMAALTGFTSCPAFDETNYDGYVKGAYIIADAMLAERQPDVPNDEVKK